MAIPATQASPHARIATALPHPHVSSLMPSPHRYEGSMLLFRFGFSSLRHPLRRRSLVAITLVLLGSMSPVNAAEDATAKQVDKSSEAKLSSEAVTFFESKVRPLLIQHCYECHSHEADAKEGELYLDSREGLRIGGTRGAAITPTDLSKSVLLQAVEYSDSDMQMPPEGKLDDAAIATLRQWIEMGAPDPRVIDPDALTAGAAKVSPMDIDPKSHWAFVAPQSPPGPQQLDPRSHDVIDDFAASKASERGVRLSEPSGRDTLIRRLYFDLTGLPPSESQIERFVTSSRPDAYVRIVDSLLASPEYAERFARHWLDVARYADTVGYALGGKERRLKGSDRYRDWTIRAFATDMPYHEMILHQLAGDRTDPDNQAGNLDAMGFLTVGRRYLNRLDTLDDRIDVITRGLVGLTVSCARCHDHKFDPIPTSDYYSMFGILTSSAHREEGASPLMMADIEKPHDHHILVRGQQGNRGPIATRQYFTALRGPDDSPFRDGSGRLELANKIASPENPLTSRVLVNRLWGHLIGKPLVDSTSDFGVRTPSPAVVEVLDELAVDFAKHQSIKKTVRRIVLSRIYRQSAQASEQSIELDPDNELLARANRRRRDFESLRDSLLLVSGSLERTIGGEPVEITASEPTARRTIYAMIDRQNLPAVFRTFDFASPDAHSPHRYFTTVPQQSLYLLNGSQTLELARRVAREVRDAVGQTNDAERHSALATELVQRVFSRQPTAAEREAFVTFLQREITAYEPPINPAEQWSYGTTTLDSKRRVGEFVPFTVFKDNRWQAADTIPLAGPLGYASLLKDRGHSMRQSDGGLVRRWTSPVSGNVTITGRLSHSEARGDGVQADVWCGPKQIFSEVGHNEKRDFGPLTSRIEKGQTIDFVVNGRASDAFDSFVWRANIRIVTDDGQRIETDSSKDFQGPQNRETVRPLDQLEQLAQVLLMSNEFAFVD
ncbi:Planctomycete cytochrome C [Novipirellula galeiformis]|uniref:Planctomycete cytochrome C n=2 Tax=Novipirellula galeiformis TaxID=2528004 RepID=A0A5C6CE27_9BACT|nr:Planctomycete cytochrome C [Novipirellula galeiformis]